MAAPALLCRCVFPYDGVEEVRMRPLRARTWHAGLATRQCADSRRAESTPRRAGSSGHRLIALQGHLKLPMNAIVRVTSQTEVWWSGIFHGASGWFPASFVEASQPRHE